MGKDNLSDENVISVLMEAEKFEMESLSSAALEHLAERPLGKSLNEVPGFKEAFQAQAKPVKDLLAIMSEKNASLKEEVSLLRQKIQHLEEQKIKITIRSGEFYRLYFVNEND